MNEQFKKKKKALAVAYYVINFPINCISKGKPII